MIMIIYKQCNLQTQPPCRYFQSSVHKLTNCQSNQRLRNQIIIQMNIKQNASVGEESISMSPPKRNVSWTLLLKESHFPQAPCLVTLNLLRFLTAPLPSSAYRQNTKNYSWVTKALGSQYYGETKHTCRNVCTWSSGECSMWPVRRQEPLDTTPPIYGDRTTRKCIGQSYATCLYLLLVRDDLEVTDVGLSSVTSHSFSTGSSAFVIYYSSLLSNILLITGGTNALYNSETKYSSVRTFSS